MTVCARPVRNRRRWTVLAPAAAFGALLAGGAAAQSTARIDIAYREAADAFEILDNVSEWWPGYTDATYRTFWADSLGISAGDSALLVRYAKLRERYFDRTGQEGRDPHTSRSGLFTDGATLAADPVAHAFYRSETLEEALDRLAGVIEPDEVAFLRSFYDHFSPRLARLTADTRRSVAPSLERTRAALAQRAVVTYVDDIRDLFGIEEDVSFTALYVWWPDAERIQANPNGAFLILRVRPHEGEAINSADVVVHEAVHAISALQPDARKRSMSDVILAGCPGALDRTRRLGVIEEPLATILGNMEFRRRFDPDRFSWGREWYGEPTVDLLARLLYPVVMDLLADGRTLDGPFGEDAAALCRIAG